MKYFCLGWVFLELVFSTYYALQRDYAHATFFLVWVVIAIEMWRMYDDENGNPFA